MKNQNAKKWVVGLAAGAVCSLLALADANPKNVLSGPSAYASFTNVKPGTWRHITPADLPKAGATPSVSNAPRVVSKPSDAWPQAPEGFKVELYASSLNGPRIIRA